MKSKLPKSDPKYREGPTGFNPIEHWIDHKGTRISRDDKEGALKTVEEDMRGKKPKKEGQ